MNTPVHLTSLLCRIFYHYKCASCDEKNINCNECRETSRHLSNLVISTIPTLPTTGVTYSPRVILPEKEEDSNEEILKDFTRIITSLQCQYNENTLRWLAPAENFRTEINRMAVLSLVLAGALETPKSDKGSAFLFAISKHNFCDPATFKWFLGFGLKVDRSVAPTIESFMKLQDPSFSLPEGSLFTDF